MAITTFSQLFAQDSPFSTPTASCASIESATGVAAAASSAAVLHRVAQLSTRTKIMVALVSQEDPSMITMIQLPSQHPCDLIATPMDGEVCGLLGNFANSVMPIWCPPAMFDVIQVTALATHAAACTAIATNPTPAGLNAHVADGAPNSALETTRRSLVIPLEWTPLAVDPPDQAQSDNEPTAVQSVDRNDSKR